MGILSLGYASVESPNYKEWEQFGPEIFGMELAEAGPGGAVQLRLDDRHHRLSFHPGERDRLRYLGWEVRDLTAWEATAEDLRRGGVAVDFATDEELDERRVQGMVHLRDPYGLRHEIYYGQEFSPSSFRPGRAGVRFVADHFGLGHTTLIVPGIAEEQRQFYAQTLGLNPWYEVGRRGAPAGAYFFRGGSRRGDLFGVMAVPGMLGLHHIMVEVDDLDAVGRAYDLVQERDIPLALTLGKHAPDPFVSFYCYSPSGFLLEYGTGSRDMKEDPDWVMISGGLYAEAWGHKHVNDDIPSTVEKVD